jgi:hypothetical protein
MIETVKLQATQDKIAPKFCTNITVALLTTKNVILTMEYKEAGAECSALIGRVVIDLKHAENLRNILSKILEKNYDK